LTIELLIEADANRYVTRTLDGATAGGEIWTHLTPVEPRRTDIEVEFQLPDVHPESADALGAAYRSLYTRLWDEDEEMMIQRQAELDRARDGAVGVGSAEVVLGPEQEVRARVPFSVEVRGRRYRVVAIGGDLVAHATTCPHRLGPLENAAVEEGFIECPWHGYRFDVRTGRSADARGLRLPPAPVIRGTDVLKIGFDE
jgi:nitrite reductase/ring-hydroxylating ferredoxin subunit